MHYFRSSFILLLSMCCKVIVAQTPVVSIYDNNKYLKAYMEASEQYHTSESTTSLYDAQIDANGNKKNVANKKYYEYGKKNDFSGGLQLTWTHAWTATSVKEVRITVGRKSDYSDAITYTLSSRTSYLLGNLLPGQHYYYKVEEVKKTTSEISLRKSGDFTTTGLARLITVDGVDNVRDVGGWPTQFGYPVRYGLLYRSAQFDAFPEGSQIYVPTITQQGLFTVRQVCGINAELDIRGDGQLTSCLGEDVDFKSFAQGGEAMPFFGKGMTMPEKAMLLAEQLQWMIDEMKKGKVVDFHCTFGADRAGTTALVIEGLLGMAPADIDRDYELTSLYGSHRQRSASYYREMYDIAQSFAPDGDLAQGFYNFWLSLGISANDLDYFRNHMLGFYLPYVIKKIIGQVEATAETQTIEPAGWSSDGITPGDLNGDGKINVADIIKYHRDNK